jgi:hypothetical protein
VPDPESLDVNVVEVDELVTDANQIVDTDSVLVNQVDDLLHEVGSVILNFDSNQSIRLLLDQLVAVSVHVFPSLQLDPRLFDRDVALAHVAESTDLKLGLGRLWGVLLWLGLGLNLGVKERGRGGERVSELVNASSCKLERRREGREGREGRKRGEGREKERERERERGKGREGEREKKGGVGRDRHGEL